MKAAYLTGHGGVDKFVYGDLPDPVAGPGEVVVDVHAASVNAADYKVRLGGGAYSGASNLKFPYVLGRDFSGLVAALGPGVTDFKIGDPVFGVMDAGIEGCYAEKVKIAAAIIARKPDSLGDAEAAAMALTSLTAIWALEDTAKLQRGETVLIQGGAGGGPRVGVQPAHHIREAAAMALTSLTAIWALEDTAKLQRGETVLIQGGAGGVAGFAIQLAKHIGADVITTASARNHDYVRKLGADRVIDYNTEDFTRTVSGVDVVFDTVGGEVQVRSYEVLKPGGRLVWIAGAPAGFQPSRKDVEVLRPRVARDRAHLERMKELLAAGAVSPPAITSYKLADAAEAHRVSEGRHLQGKLVLIVR